jgi:hypothetical protein
MHAERVLEHRFLPWFKGRLTDDRLGGSAPLQGIDRDLVQSQRLVTDVFQPERGLDLVSIRDRTFVVLGSIDGQAWPTGERVSGPGRLSSGFRDIADDRLALVLATSEDQHGGNHKDCDADNDTGNPE